MNVWSGGERGERGSAERAALLVHYRRSYRSLASDAGGGCVAGRMGTERGETVRTLDKTPWVRTDHHSGR